MPLTSEKTKDPYYLILRTNYAQTRWSTQSLRLDYFFGVFLTQEGNGSYHFSGHFSKNVTREECLSKGLTPREIPVSTWGPSYLTSYTFRLLVITIFSLERHGEADFTKGTAKLCIKILFTIGDHDRGGTRSRPKTKNLT